MGDWVLHIALCTSIVGLVLITFASEALEPPYSSVGDIDTGFIGKNVHIRGNISDIHQFKGGSLMIKISELNDTLDIFLPYSVSTQIDFNPELGNLVDLIGVIEVYQGRLEVVVDKQSNLRLVENES